MGHWLEKPERSETQGEEKEIAYNYAFFLPGIENIFIPGTAPEAFNKLLPDRFLG
jgi:hypothetical protein